MMRTIFCKRSFNVVSFQASHFLSSRKRSEGEIDWRRLVMVSQSKATSKLVLRQRHHHHPLGFSPSPRHESETSSTRMVARKIRTTLATACAAHFVRWILALFQPLSHKSSIVKWLGGATGELFAQPFASPTGAFVSRVTRKTQGVKMVFLAKHELARSLRQKHHLQSTPVDYASSAFSRGPKSRGSEPHPDDRSFVLVTPRIFRLMI